MVQFTGFTKTLPNLVDKVRQEFGADSATFATSEPILEAFDHRWLGYAMANGRGMEISAHLIERSVIEITVTGAGKISFVKFIRNSTSVMLHDLEYRILSTNKDNLTWPGTVPPQIEWTGVIIDWVNERSVSVSDIEWLEWRLDRAIMISHAIEDRITEAKGSLANLEHRYVEAGGAIRTIRCELASARLKNYLQ